MKYFALVAVVLSSLLHFPVLAAQAIPPSALAALKATYSNCEVAWETVGRLSSELSDDVVFVIIDNEEVAPSVELDSKPSRVFRIVFLQKKMDEGYLVRSQTKDLEVMMAIYNFRVEIRNRSLFVNTSWPKGPNFSVDDFQFRLVDGGLRLVGLERDMGSTEEAHQDEVYKISANLLTGQKKDTLSYVENGKRRTKVKWTRFHVAPILLEDFDFFSGLESAMSRNIGRD